MLDDKEPLPGVNHEQNRMKIKDEKSKLDD